MKQKPTSFLNIECFEMSPVLRTATAMNTKTNVCWLGFQDFVQCVLEKVKPARGRQLAAELLQGSLNWKEYYEQYGLSVGGLVPNAHRPDDSVNHCWRFIRRSDTQPQRAACFHFVR